MNGNSELYFSRDGVLTKLPFHAVGKYLIIISKVALHRILIMAHNTPITGHFAREQTVHAIQTSMEWPGVAKYVK